MILQLHALKRELNILLNQKTKSPAVNNTYTACLN